MGYEEWNAWQHKIKELNVFIESLGGPPIICNNRRDSEADLRNWCRWVMAEAPEVWARVPQWLREWMPRGYFIRIPQWFVDDGLLRDLTPQEWYVLTVFSRFAYFGVGTNENGCSYGETFVGRERVAELTGMSIPTVDRIIRSLVGKGYLENVHRRKYSVRRAVMHMLG